jgi:hypothetical protein
MAKRQITLTDREINELRRAETPTQTVQEWKRLQAVRLYGEGQPTREIEALLGCSWRR